MPNLRTDPGTTSWNRLPETTSSTPFLEPIPGTTSWNHFLEPLPGTDFLKPLPLPHSSNRFLEPLLGIHFLEPLLGLEPQLWERLPDHFFEAIFSSRLYFL
jgi:hypothetical protein